MILVTGGAGFIGSHFVIDWFADPQTRGEAVVTLDALTYCGHRVNLANLPGEAPHEFVRGDINDRALLDHLLATHRPRALVHFAAETHVDRSIAGADAFVHSNIVGTHALLEAWRRHAQASEPPARAALRFLHVSTDEVYGSLGPDAPAFTESHPVAPNSPYAASKAASDHLVRAWQQTHGLATLVTRCSNNFGPRQFLEKLIPVLITQALAGRPLPVYGDGQQRRDWLYVGDHCAALRRVLTAGQVGCTYNIGGGNEMSNLELVHRVCGLLDQICPAPGGPYSRLVTHVGDRAGHDRRYAIDSSRVRHELGWRPARTFAEGLEHTVRWYLDHPDWLREVQGRRQPVAMLPQASPESATDAEGRREP